MIPLEMPDVIEFNQLKNDDIIHGITRIAGQRDNNYFHILRKMKKTALVEIYSLEKNNTVHTIRKKINIEGWNNYWLPFLKMTYSDNKELAKILLKKEIIQY
jgi:hypothetical protein